MQDKTISANISILFSVALTALSAHAIVPAPVVAAYTNDFAILEFDRLGRVARLADRHDGRSLVRTYPALDVVGENGVARHARRLAAREAVFAADRKSGKKIRHDAYWRKSLPVVFRWKATADEIETFRKIMLQNETEG